MFLFNFNLHIQISWMNFKFKLAKMPFGLHSVQNHFSCPSGVSHKPTQIYISVGLHDQLYLATFNKASNLPCSSEQYSTRHYFSRHIDFRPPYIRIHTPEWQIKSNFTNSIIIDNKHALLQRIAINYTYIN